MLVNGTNILARYGNYIKIKNPHVLIDKNTRINESHLIHRSPYINLTSNWMIKSRNKNMRSKVKITEKSIIIPGPPKGERWITFRTGERIGSVILYI